MSGAAQLGAARDDAGGGIPAGTVFLVGAGPGDPGLITVRGRDLLAECEAVVVDALTSPRLLDGCRPDCERHLVGKRAGQHSSTQAEINQLLVALARRGLSVVRLKGGDPFVFGRGGEECEALRDAGITFEVVPGVTSAVAAPAAAGIPVTHRDWASHVTVVTGHERDGPGEPRVDLAGLAPLVETGTLVFLMGARNLGLIVDGLRRGGAHPQTAAAAVQWGTDPRQRTVVATLGDIERCVAEEGMGSPMVTVVGRVAELGRSLDWLASRPLVGRRIIVTRARAQSSGFLERLRRFGADAVELPVIATEPLAERAELLAGVDWLAGGTETGIRYAVFTSANAVALVFDELDAAGADARRWHRVRVVAIGPETAAALRSRGVRADLVPSQFVAEAVAEAMLAEGVAGARVLMPRAAAARDVLPDRLRDAGADVRVIAIYRTVLAAGAAEALRSALAGGRIDAVTFTSSSTVERFREVLGGAGFPPDAIAACIGPITERAAREAGFPVAVVASEFTTAGLAQALVAHFSSAPAAGSAAQPLP